MTTMTMERARVDVELLTRRSVLPAPAVELDVVMAAVTRSERLIGRMLSNAGQSSLVDDVLADTRILLWQRLVVEAMPVNDVNAYAFVVARNEARAAIRRSRREIPVGLGREDEHSALSEPIEDDDDTADIAVRWARYIRDEVGQQTWERFAALAFDENVSSVELRTVMPSSRWVQQVASTIKAAMQLAVTDARPPMQRIASACLPGRLAESLMVPEAECTGRTLRYRRDARRLLDVALRVHTAEAPMWL